MGLAEPTRMASCHGKQVLLIARSKESPAATLRILAADIATPVNSSRSRITCTTEGGDFQSKFSGVAARGGRFIRTHTHTHTPGTLQYNAVASMIMAVASSVPLSEAKRTKHRSRRKGDAGHTSSSIAGALIGSAVYDTSRHHRCAWWRSFATTLDRPTGRCYERYASNS